MKTILARALSLVGILGYYSSSTLQAQGLDYKYSQFKNEVSVTIPVPYTPFGNRIDFNRYGDDGSKCVLDASGVLTWVDKDGLVRLLPNTSKAVPLFVTNSECLVWSNRFVDYNSYTNRPDASLVLYRGTPGSSTVTSSSVTFQGKEALETSPATTITNPQSFISTTRKDNGNETKLGTDTFNYNDDADIRFYRLTFDAGVQFVTALSIPVKAAASFATGVVGPNITSFGYGSDGSLMVKIPQVQTNNPTTPSYEDQHYWFDSQGRGVLLKTAPIPAVVGPPAVPAVLALTESVSQVLFCSNTRLVYVDGATPPQIKEQRRIFSTGNLSGSPTAVSGVTGTVLDLNNYSRVDDKKFIYSLGPDFKTIRTYQLGSTANLISTTTLAGNITSAAVTGTVNPTDGSALIWDEDSASLIWLHTGGTGSDLIGTRGSAALFVTNEQAVIWENAKAQPGPDGSLPKAIVAHYSRAVSPLARTVITSEGTNLLNTARITPLLEYWYFTTSEKTSADTAALKTYKLGDFEILDVDTDSDGILDYYEVNPTAPNPVTNPFDADTDDDGLNDGYELANATNPADSSSFPTYLLDLVNSGTTTGGTFSKTAGNLAHGSTATLVAVPSYGYVLQSWTDNLSGSALTQTLLMDGNKTVNAVFAVDIRDFDGDGLTDIFERSIGTNTALADTDGDGVNDYVEHNITKTNPLVNSFGDPGATTDFPFFGAGLAGVYEGIVFDSSGAQVMKQSIRMTNNGSFTSSLFGFASNSSFKGMFSATGSFTGVPGTGSGLIAVQMKMVRQPNGRYYIQGTFTNPSGGTFFFQLRPAVGGIAGNVTFEASVTTAGIGPSGAAVATGKFRANGQVSLNVYFPDGGTGSYSGPTVDGNLMAFFCKAKSKGHAVLLGSLTIQDIAGQSDFSGGVRNLSFSNQKGSLYPSGYDQNRFLTGSRYYAPRVGFMPLATMPLGANNMVLEWADATLPGQKVATWSNNGKVYVPPTQSGSTKVNFTKATGLYVSNSNLTNVTAGYVNFKSKEWAVAVQKNNTFRGFYISGFTAGAFSLLPNNFTPPLVPAITSVLPLSVNAPAAGKTYTVSVGTSDPNAWGVSIPIEAFWVTAVQYTAASDGVGSGTVVITLGLNALYERREAVITIAGVQHTIKQEYR